MAASDGGDAAGLSDQFVPGLTAMIEDLIVGIEDAVGEPIIAHELPDVFNRVERGTFGWQRDDADVVGYDERAGHMPPGLIHEHDGMSARRHVAGDFGQMQGHRARVADRQDKPCALLRAGQIAPKI